MSRSYYGTELCEISVACSCIRILVYHFVEIDRITVVKHDLEICRICSDFPEILIVVVVDRGHSEVRAKIYEVRDVGSYIKYVFILASCDLTAVRLLERTSQSNVSVVVDDLACAYELVVIASECRDHSALVSYHRLPWHVIVCVLCVEFRSQIAVDSRIVCH